MLFKPSQKFQCELCCHIIIIKIIIVNYSSNKLLIELKNNKKDIKFPKENLEINLSDFKKSIESNINFGFIKNIKRYKKELICIGDINLNSNKN